MNNVVLVDHDEARQRALRAFRTSVNSSVAAIWSLQLEPVPRLVASYADDLRGKLQQQLFGSQVILGTASEGSLRGSFPEIETLFKNLGTQHVTSRALTSDVPLAGGKMGDLLGAVCFDSTAVEETVVQDACDRLASSLAMSRASRLIDALSVTAQVQAEPGEQGLDSTIRDLCDHVGRLIGATQTSVIFGTTHPAAHFSEPYAVRLQVVRKESGANGGLSIVLGSPAYLLKPAKFELHNAFQNGLERRGTPALVIEFDGKSRQHYLQHEFSDLDLEICRCVFQTIHPYVLSRIGDDHYRSVASFLSDNDPSRFQDPSQLQDLFQNISPSNEACCLVEIDSVGGQVNFVTRASRPDVVMPSTLERDLRSYAEEFLKGERGEAGDDWYIGGFPGDDGRFYLAAHFSNSLGSSRVLVLRRTEATVPEPEFRALLHLFGELHIRYMIDDHAADRVAYITQVRHALAQHVAGAAIGIDTVRMAWDSAKRFRHRWANLYDDPIVPPLISQIQWSMAQVALLIENGRFLLGDISPKSLNRKGLRILDLANDTARALEYFRDQRDIQIESKITGRPPSVMNGDEALMRIVLMNLFDNAIKYSRVGKRVRWTLSYHSDHYIFGIRSVSDPISEDQKAYIMQPFKRIKQKDHLNLRHGTGLGLPVAKRILDAHWPRNDFQPYNLDPDTDFTDATVLFSFKMPYFTGTGVNQQIG